MVNEKKSKFSFNCIKCGNCCEDRGPIPIILDDLLRWSRNNVATTIIPKLSFIKTDYGTLDLVLSNKSQNPYGLFNSDSDKKEKTENLTCPFYNNETKSCVIYENRPLSCRTYPLEYDGKNFMVIDAENCPGIGHGTNTKDEIKKMRTLAKKMNQKLTEMRISMPILSQTMQPYVLQEIMQMQQKYMEEFEKMSPEQKKQFEEQMESQMNQFKEK